MTIPYAESYLGQVRALVGKRKLIVNTARAIVQDQAGRILLIRRSDNGDWAMPAGTMELGESILDCVKREVKEETDLDVLSAYPIAIYSDPRYSQVTSYGDPFQPMTVVFLVDAWEGTLLEKADETVDARFFSLDALPSLSRIYLETIEDLANFGGRVIMK